jgi:hypothetical protein
VDHLAGVTQAVSRREQAGRGRGAGGRQGHRGVEAGRGPVEVCHGRGDVGGHLARLSEGRPPALGLERRVQRPAQHELEDDATRP